MQHRRRQRKGLPVVIGMVMIGQRQQTKVRGALVDVAIMGTCKFAQNGDPADWLTGPRGVLVIGARD